MFMFFLRRMHECMSGHCLGLGRARRRQADWSEETEEDKEDEGKNEDERGRLRGTPELRRLRRIKEDLGSRKTQNRKAPQQRTVFVKLLCVGKSCRRCNA